jgi:hypothetical protein
MEDIKKQTQSTRPFDVGYGKPPKSGQFRKGCSGNSKSRIRGEENLITVFKRFAKKRVKVSDNGAARRLTMAEVVIVQNVKAALNGDPIAMSNILRMADHAGEFLDSADPKVAGKPLFLPAAESTEELLAFYGSGIIERPQTRTGVQPDL